MTSDARLELLKYPELYSSLSNSQLNWFESDSVFNTTDSTIWDCSSVSKYGCCSNIDIDVVPTSRLICECWGGDWTQVVSQNFDNYGTALLSFWEISSTEGWVDVMYAAVNSNGIDMQPIYDNKVQYIYYFIFFIVIGNFFCVNLFVGVLLNNYNKLLNEQGKKGLYTDSQREWIETQAITLKIRPKIKIPLPKEYLCLKAYHIISSLLFEKFIMFCIIANTILFAIHFWGQSTVYENILNTFNSSFIIIFTLEAILKLMAQKMNYFKSNWNIFDFIIVLGSIFGFILYYVFNDGAIMVITMIRIFRIFRLVSLLKENEKLNQLIISAAFILPGFVNIFGLLMIFFYIYSIMGIQMFATIGFHGSYDVHANFRSIGISLSNKTM